MALVELNRRCILATDPPLFTQFYDKLKNDPAWTVHTLPYSHFIHSKCLTNAGSLASSFSPRRNQGGLVTVQFTALASVRKPKGAQMRLRKNGDSWLGICSIAVLLMLMTGAAVAEERQALSRGQTVYVPVYSHIWYGNVDLRLKASKLLLSSMLSIRNVDPDHSIVVNMVRYHDTDGKLLKEDSMARTLAPLASTDVFVEFKDDTGGAGAKFIVVWQADVPVNPPIIESVNTHFQGTQLTVFVSRGRPIK